MCMDEPTPGDAHAASSSCAALRRLNETCPVVCQEGYSGSETYTCAAVGYSQWSGDNLVCTANACNAVPTAGAGYGKLKMYRRRVPKRCPSAGWLWERSALVYPWHVPPSDRRTGIRSLTIRSTHALNTTP